MTSEIDATESRSTFELLSLNVAFDILARGATLEILPRGVTFEVLAFVLVSSLTRFPSLGFASWTSQICNSHMLKAIIEKLEMI